MADSRQLLFRPHGPLPGPCRELDVQAARAAIAAALPDPGPDTPVYLFTKDRDIGGSQLDEAAQEGLERTHEALLQVERLSDFPTFTFTSQFLYIHVAAAGCVG